MRKLWLLTFWLLPLPGCGGAPTSSEPANTAVLAHNGLAGNNVDAANEVAAEPVAANLVVAPTSRAVDLSAYVGKYAHDEVDGVTFLEHPAVRSAVEGVVSDPVLRNRFLTAAVQSQIEAQGTRVVSWGCERHNCPHTWGISVDQTTGDGEVCYVRSPRVRWYHRGGMEELDDCPF